MKDFLNRPVEEKLAISILVAVYVACMIILSLIPSYV